MYLVLMAALAWLLGDVAMEGLLWGLRKLKIVRTDSVRGVGLLWRHSFRRSVVPGLVIHLIIGAALTALMALIVTQLPSRSLVQHMFLGTFFGAVVGLAASMAFSELMQQESFFQQFPRRAIGVATAAVPGYLVYGMVVALVLSVSWPIFS